MSAINVESIKEIEIYVNNNNNILENTTFKNTVPFAFRPGDRSLLLNLPAYIEVYKEKKQTNKRVAKVTQKEKSEAEIKIELFNKLMKYAKDKNYAIELKNEDLTEFVKEGTSCRCRLRCVFCSMYMYIVCSYNSFWTVSNYQTHFKDHIKSIESQKQNENLDENRSDTLDLALDDVQENSLGNFSVVSNLVSNIDVTKSSASADELAKILNM